MRLKFTDNSTELRIMQFTATLACFMVAVFDTAIGITEGWPGYVAVIIWCQMALILWSTYDRRISIRLHSYAFMFFVTNTIFISGLYMHNYYVTFIMLTGTFLFGIFFHDLYLLVFQFVLVEIVNLFHVFVFQVVPLDKTNNKMEFIMAVLIQTLTGLALILRIGADGLVRKNLEETAQKAEAAERAKSDFLANMSHEIRTPMNAIIGMCELILREGNLSQSVREFCGNIQNSGRSLLSIINDILDFSKIESGKMELIEDEFNIASTLNDVINMTLTRMKNKKIEFIVQVDPGIPKGLIGDEIRIRQIMINLLTNAVKYTNEGAITLRISKTVRSYGINLNVSIKDSGIGITKKNLEKLFNSFQQVDTKKNRAVEGTGLGLVITKRLLASMGGFINVQSEYGKGSEFRFVVPLKVKDKMPFIHVENADAISVATYIDMEKFTMDCLRVEYKHFIEDISESLQVRNFYCKKFEDLKMRVERGKITHCFVGKEEFLAHKAFFEDLANKIVVVIVQDRRDAVSVPQNMRCIYKPIYELSVAGILNNESIISDIQSAKAGTISFTAPKARILIVDDNAVNLQVASGLMQPYKMQILTVTSGKDAIRMLGSKDFDLVFMDHMMPEMDGVEATKLIRSKPEEYYKKLPIVALTANAVGGAREMFIANGFNGFLAKPIELSALDRVLKQNLPQNLIVRPSDEMLNSALEQASEIEVSDEIAEMIHVKTGLFYTGGSKDAYLSILETYVGKGDEKVIQLRELFNKKEWRNYIIEAHALKSSSLSIGAKELSEVAKTVELAGKAGDMEVVMQNHDRMCELYEQVLIRAKKLLADNKTQDAPEEPAEVTEISKEELTALIEQLKVAMDAYDSDEIVKLAKEHLHSVYGELELTQYLDGIKTAADNFEYESAAEQLSQLESLIDKEDGADA